MFVHTLLLLCLVCCCCLQLAALQTVSASDAQALSSIPGDEVLSAAANFPPGSVTRMQDNIKAALSGDTKCISMLRTLKLYLERMGTDKQQVGVVCGAGVGVCRVAVTAIGSGCSRSDGDLRLSLALDTPVHATTWDAPTDHVVGCCMCYVSACVLCYLLAQDVPAAAHFSSGMFRLLRAVLIDPMVLSWRPAVVAAAVLVAARTTVGCYPFFPSCLEQLTGSTLDNPDVAAAIAAIKPLAAAAGLEPPARCSPIGPPHFGGRPLSAGPGLFGCQLGPGSFNGSCSGYSTPSHAGTPTAAAAAAAALAAAQQLQFAGMPQKSLLDAVVRQHRGSQHRNSSDMSSVTSAQTCSDAGSAGDLQALLSASAAFAAGATSSAGSLGGHSSSPLLTGAGPCSEPLLAAAMAGLQLGALQQHHHQSAPGSPHMPWLGGAGSFDNPFQGGFQPMQQQQGQQQGHGSRLSQMTTPYVMPHAMQQASYLFNNAAHMQR